MPYSVTTRSASAARRRDDPVGELGDDARTGAFAIGRLQRDDRTPLRGAVGGTYKIHLAADEADVSSACGLGIDLTGEVDLERAIDRDEAWPTTPVLRVLWFAS